MAELAHLSKRWPIITSISHGAVAAVITAAVSTLGLIGVVNAAWMGAAAAIGYYWGRETAQAQKRIAAADGSASVIGYGWVAFRPDRWGRDGVLDVAVPIIAAIAVSVWLTVAL